MNRVTAVLAFSLIAIAYSSNANAGSVEGTISKLIVRQSDGLTYFYMTGTPTDKPTCAIKPYWIITDENSEAGKKLYAMLLAAKLSGSVISVSGSNACTRWFDGEDVLSVIVN